VAVDGNDGSTGPTYKRLPSSTGTALRFDRTYNTRLRETLMNILVLMVGAILVQAPAVPLPVEAQARIEGIVMGSNGGLTGAQVSALWNPLPASYSPDALPRTTTSSDGRFSIQVSPGAYQLTARAAGYVTQTGKPLQLRPNEVLTSVMIVLPAEGILSGRVAANDGQPLVRIEVVALKKTFTATGLSLDSRGRAQTNDRGEYRIPGLSAGSYLISASGLNPLTIAYEVRVAERNSTAAPVASSPGAFGPIYYPNADQSSRALAVEIQAGIEARNIDFVLPKRSVYAIRGRVIGAPTIQVQGQPRSTANISIRPANAEYSSGLSSAPLNPEGTFELPGVAPGFHWVIAQVPATLTAEQRALVATPGADLSQAQLPRPLRGIALVRVIDGDVENVELTMVRDLELSGHLSIDGERFDFSGRSREFSLELRPTDPIGNGTPNNFSSLEGGGELVYKRLLPTEYRLTISALPSPFFVKEARYGNIDVLAETIHLIEPSPDRLNILLARGSEVGGTLTDDAAGLLGSHKVVLVPEGMPQRLDLYKTAVTDPAGGFTVSGVAPGDYRAFAWQVFEDFQYLDAAFVSRFRERGTSFRVEGTSKAGIRVSLIR
jgi:hypothetical protein